MKIKKLKSKTMAGVLLEEDSQSTIVSMDLQTEKVTIDQSAPNEETQTITLGYEVLLQALMSIDSDMMEVHEANLVGD